METIFVSLVSIILIIASSMTMTINGMKSMNKTTDSWKQMVTRSIEINRTSIVAVLSQSYTGSIMELTVINNGQTSLNDFTAWDVIAQYQSGAVTYLTYTPEYPPGENYWTMEGIYMSNGEPEVFNPGILDPTEQMTMAFLPNPELSVGQTCRITIATPNGVKTQIDVTME